MKTLLYADDLIKGSGSAKAGFNTFIIGWCSNLKTKMTFEQFYQTVTTQANVAATREYVRILWSYAYTIEQAVHNLQTMDES